MSSFKSTTRIDELMEKGSSEGLSESEISELLNALQDQGIKVVRLNVNVEAIEDEDRKGNVH